jgi:K+-transporting ATPase ATPase C chain
LVQERIDSFLVHNPAVKKKEIPSELVTASGSGLDPDISPAAAKIQIARIASVRNIDQRKLHTLVETHTGRPDAWPVWSFKSECAQIEHSAGHT